MKNDGKLLSNLFTKTCISYFGFNDTFACHFTVCCQNLFSVHVSRLPVIFNCSLIWFEIHWDTNHQLCHGSEEEILVRVTFIICFCHFYKKTHRRSFVSICLSFQVTCFVRIVSTLHTHVYVHTFIIGKIPIKTKAKMPKNQNIRKNTMFKACGFVLVSKKAINNNSY